MSGYNAVLARNTQNAPKAIGPYSQTVAFSHYNNLSAQLPIDPKTGKLVAGGVKEQAEQCFKNIKAVVESINHVMDDVVRITIFVKNIADLDAVSAVYKTFFTTGYVPALTTVAVAALPMNALVQVEALLSNGEGTIPNAPQAGDLIKIARNTAAAPQSPLSTQTVALNAPKAIGPYSQTVAFSHYNNLSAQLPIDPKTGKLVAGGVKEQAEQCFKNIKAVVESINHVMDDVVRITIFVKNIADLDAVSAVYKTFFTTGYVPALTTVAVAALPMNALVQVEALLSNGEGTIPNAPQAGDLIKIARNTAAAPQSPLSTQTVAFSHYNNISAQLPIDPKTGKLVAGGVKEQAAQCLRNIKNVLEGIDVPFDDIVKINIFLMNLSDLEAVNEVYTTFFPDSAIARTVAYVPARTAVEVAGLPMNALVQIEAVVSHGDGTPPQAVEDRHGIVIKPNNTDKAPKCALSTQTVAFSHYNHISAQLPVDAKTGELVAGGVKEQAAQCLSHIKAIVESIGHKMDDVVKVNVFVKNIDDMAAVDEAYATFFPGYVPARRTVGVANLPKGALVQIDAVVSHAEGTPPKKA
ncbi:Endoribonuclease L-PSP, putative [Laribacter hongkongensis HLHK9]|uniref:Endoribonuclease L-PSP, putative n=1 Tax=Laribacter hongkongensis (strain HLHK9) TaxID=557598 RepID=C1D8U2_LARHH|nr:Rid family detoxifying hydrolase [Laribacter hongkongensis]ACO74882.1 Endoribonuclease L-PSP, putative [Laribacter hongkongensis HLHK9]